MTTTPKPLDSLSATHTTTPIVAIGVHPVTDQVDELAFSTNRQLNTFLRLRNRADYPVFDLNRETGEWVAR